LANVEAKHGITHATIQIERSSCMENPDSAVCVDTADT